MSANVKTLSDGARPYQSERHCLEHAYVRIYGVAAPGSTSHISIAAWDQRYCETAETATVFKIDGDAHQTFSRDTSAFRPGR